MRKILNKALIAIGLLLMAFSMFFPLLCLAEGAPPSDGAYDWKQLASIPGAIAATVLIVQFIKLPIDGIKKVPTRAIVFVIALIIYALGTLATKGLDTPYDYFLVVINAAVVAVGAIGAYEISLAKIDQKK